VQSILQETNLSLNESLHVGGIDRNRTEIDVLVPQKSADLVAHESGFLIRHKFFHRTVMLDPTAVEGGTNGLNGLVKQLLASHKTAGFINQQDGGEIAIKEEVNVHTLIKGGGCVHLHNWV
jgi:hypothetical protein